MKLTEQLARQKFCPFVDREYLDGSPFQGKPTCIATRCMAWRWVTDDDGMTDRDPVGYCGITGKP